MLSLGSGMEFRIAGALTLQHGRAPNARARQFLHNNFCGFVAEMMPNCIYTYQQFRLVKQPPVTQFGDVNNPFLGRIVFTTTQLNFVHLLKGPRSPVLPLPLLSTTLLCWIALPGCLIPGIETGIKILASPRRRSCEASTSEITFPCADQPRSMTVGHLPLATFPIRCVANQHPGRKPRTSWPRQHL